MTSGTGGRVVAIGIDLVDVARIAGLMEKNGPAFTQRCFCPAEIEYANDRKRRDEHLAARFAAKEAVLKALGTGLADGISWTDIEVLRLPSGEPSISLTGRALEVARLKGINAWFISLSHTDSAAIASVVAVD